MYTTKQQQILIQYFKKNSEVKFSIEELYSAPEISRSIGKSTLYRLVKKLVKMKSIKRIVSTDSRRISYQFLYTECEKHLHLVCSQCGEIIHTDNNLLDNIEQQIEKNSAFVIDNLKTVIYGTCSDCLAHREKKL